MYTSITAKIMPDRKLLAEPGISALDALDGAADIEYTANKSASGHHGAMVTAIDGFKVDINHFWIYFHLGFQGHQGSMAISYCDWWQGYAKI